MILTSWLRAVFDRRRKPPRSNSRSAHTIELGLVRLEDRRVLSVSGGEVMLFSVGVGGAAVPDLGPVQASDIVSYDGEQFALVFDGEDVGIGSANIDAITWAGDNQFLLSFASTTTIAGLGTFNGSDILLFQADSLGENTAGTFSVFLRGSDVGLAPTPGNIDALDILEDGTLVFSTAGDVTLPAGINGASILVQDEDLVQLTPDAGGHFSTGTMRVFFDGGDAGLTVSTEDIDAVSIAGSQIRLSTVGGFSIETQPGVSGSQNDVLTFNATSLGENTTGTYVGITFDGSVEVGTFELDALDFATLTAPNNLPTAQNVEVTLDEDADSLIQLLGDDGEADLDQPLTYQIVDGPDFGVVTNFDPATGSFTYIPNANYSGTDQITYLVQETDANGTIYTSELAQVTLTIAAINDAPLVQTPQTEFTGNEGEPILIQGISLEDVEAASELHQVTVTLQSANGTLSFSQLPSTVQVTGSGTSEIQLTGTIADINLLLSQGVLFQPAEGFSGETSVNVTIQDGLGGSGDLSATGSVTLTIIAAPDPPPPPPPPVSFQDRILELLESGELDRRAERILRRVLEHPDRERLIEKAIKKVDRWEQRGRLDSDLAEELTESLEGLLDEAQDDRHCRRGHHNAVDRFFSQIGNGKLKHVGRFRC